MTTPQTVTWMTVQEIATELRVSKMTVYRLIEAGQLPATLVGKSIRVQRVDVDAYVAANRVIVAGA